MDTYKHTPRPWRVIRHVETPNAATEFSLEGLHGQMIANICGAGEANGANAVLMAAAPDLLELVKYVRNYAQLADLGNNTVTRLDAAIAKAEGRD